MLDICRPVAQKYSFPHLLILFTLQHKITGLMTMENNLEKNQYFHWFKCVSFFPLYKQNLNNGTPFDYLSANAFFFKDV